jgi:hypothetical protein
MAKQPTKADLERTIAEMREAPSAEERLILALAVLITSPNVVSIKHLFFRRDTIIQINLDMHEKPTRTD